MSCPICGNPNMVCSRYVDDISLVEETKKCPKCGYYYEFSYGNYQESFGKYYFSWHYTLYNNRNLYMLWGRKIHRAKFMTRRNYRKGYRK